MIIKVELENFQSHGKSLFVLSPGLNIIEGNSNEGKSSFVRALRWMLDNAKGKGYIRKGQQECTVRVRSDKGFAQRIIGKDKNQFSIGGKTFDKPLSMPPEMKDVLNLTDINIQTQHHPYFLILDSPGNVARAINDAINLEKLNDAIQKVNKDYKDTIKTSQEITQMVTDIVASLPNMEMVKHGLKLSEELKSNLSELARLESRLSELKILITRRQQVQESLDASVKKSQVIGDVQGQLLSAKKGKEFVSKWLEYNRLNYQEQRLLPTISKLQGILSKHESVSLFKDVSVKLESLSKANERLDGIQRTLSKLVLPDVNRLMLCKKVFLSMLDWTTYESKTNRCSVEIVKIEKNMEEKVGQYVSLLSSSGRCPVCFSPVTFDEEFTKRVWKSVGLKV